MSIDQFAHMLRHTATGGGDITPYRYGHIATYDMDQHRIRAIIPSLTDQDGTPMLSPWMPMGTLSAGAGFGIQVIYAGGASTTNPTAGEQVLVGFFDRQRGVSAVPCMFFHANHPPPATNLPKKSDGYGSDAAKPAPGDVIISAPSATEGGANSFVRMRQSGDVEAWIAGKLLADAIGDVDVTTETGNVNVNVTKGDANIIVAQGNATIQAAQTVNVVGAAIRLGKALNDTLLQLCNSAFWTNFSLHTHNRGAPPDPQFQPTQAMLTQTVTAE